MVARARPENIRDTWQARSVATTELRFFRPCGSSRWSVTKSPPDEAIDFHIRRQDAAREIREIVAIDSVMRIAGLYDIDPRLLSGDQLDFAKELADPARIQHAAANIGHGARVAASITPLRRTKTQQ